MHYPWNDRRFTMQCSSYDCRKLLLIAVILFSACIPCSASGLSVLCYHQIAPDAENIMTTTPTLFASHMKYLRENGYTPLSIKDAVLHMRGVRYRSDKPFLITFDDGYDGIYTYAYPIMKRYRFPAIVFLVVSQITDSGNHHHLTWTQLDEMQKSGLLSVGSHTYNLHVKIPEELDSGRLTAGRLLNDLIISRNSIRKHLGVDTPYFAWPYGRYDDRALTTARKAGFTVFFTTDYGANHAGDGALRIRRIRLSSSYDTVERLKEKLEQFR